MTPETTRPTNAARVCAVLVTYHPDAGFADRLNRVVPQAGHTVIVDNGSSDHRLRMLRDISSSHPITLLENGANLGIAAALNTGIKHAVAHGHLWALTLDQDTEVDEDMVRTLLDTAASFPDGEQLAVVGSRFRDTHGRPPETLPAGASGPDWREVQSVITSGSLVSLNAYGALGSFREEFFIDHVDTEYCLRARAAGYRIIESRRPLMQHTVGAPSHHRLLWKERWTTNHSADRRYYIARNNTVLLREYGTPRGGSWQWKSLMRCWRLCKRIALFERDKTSKIGAVAEGWWDAMRGRMGPRRKPKLARDTNATPGM